MDDTDLDSTDALRKRMSQLESQQETFERSVEDAAERVGEVLQRLGEVLGRLRRVEQKTRHMPIEPNRYNCPHCGAMISNPKAVRCPMCLKALPDEG